MIYHTYSCLKDILIVIWAQRLLHWGHPKIQNCLKFLTHFFFFSLLLEYGSGLVTKSHLTLTIPWAIACQAPLFIGFSRQEYWNSLRFLLQRIFPTQGSILGLLHCRQILYQLSHREASIYSVVLVSGVNKWLSYIYMYMYIYIYIPFYISSVICYYKILSVVHCDIQ